MRFSKPALPALLRLLAQEANESPVDEVIDDEEKQDDCEGNETEDECKNGSEDEDNEVEEYWITDLIKFGHKGDQVSFCYLF